MFATIANKQKSTVFSIIVFVLFFYGFLSAATFSVKDYGATGNNQNDHQAIQSAIDACSNAGGGTVLFPAGEYVTGTLELKSNMSLYLEAGAVLKASRNTEDYPKRALLFGENLENIFILGPGIIDGQAEYEWKENDISDKLADNVPADFKPTITRSYPIAPNPKLVELVNCKNVKIKDITLKSSPSWTVHPWGCDGVLIDGITIDNDVVAGAWTDGIDPDCSRNVHITNCRIAAGDDGIAIKTTDHFGPARSCENIIIDNCHIVSASCGIKIGTETKADIKFVTAENCVIRKSNRGVGIIVRDTGTVSNVQFSNILIDCARHDYFWWGNGEPFYFVAWKRKGVENHGTIKNVSVSNIKAYACGTSFVEGITGRTLENFEFKDITLYVKSDSLLDFPVENKPYSFEHYYHTKIFPTGVSNYYLGRSVFKFTNINSLILDNIRISYMDRVSEKWENAVQLEKITNLNAKEIITRQPHLKSDHSAIVLDNVQSGEFYNCTALQGTETFFDIRNEKTANIQFRYNQLNQAKQGFKFEAKDLQKHVKVID